MGSMTPPPGFPSYTNPPTMMPPGATAMGAGGQQSAAPAAKPPSRRIVGVSRGLAILFALVAAVAIGSYFLIDEEPGLYVARTSTPLAELTPLAADQIVIVAIDPDFLEAGAISGDTVEAVEAALEPLYGLVTRYPLAGGQQLRSALVTDAGQLSPLGPEERLVSVPADVANAVGGALRPGDRVDVIVVDPSEDLAGFIARDVEIVAVRIAPDQLAGLSSEQIGPEGRELTPDELQPAQPIPGMYTLRVHVDVAATIASAGTQSDIHLVYRGADAVNGEGRAISLVETVCLTTVVELRPSVCAELLLPEGLEDSALLSGGPSSTLPGFTGPGAGLPDFPDPTEDM